MRVAISGSYSTGKTTTSLALSLVTGIKIIHARTMREILPVTFPGKRLEECTPSEITELIFHRLTERIVAETQNPDSFISDGSSMQEWAYCMPRLIHGMDPSERRLVAVWKKFTNLSQWRAFRDTMEAYNEMVRHHVKTHYDIFIHLPVEFPMTKDGHRPVSERFRASCNHLLQKTYRELQLPVYPVSGDMQTRIESTIGYLGLPLVMDVNDAIERAHREVRERFNNIRLETE